MQLDQDMHIHSTFSDGRHEPEQLLAMARARGLSRIGFADDVRRTTPWIPKYVAHLDGLRDRSPVELVIGVQSRLLDAEGTLDLPDDVAGVQRLHVVVDQLPLASERLSPQQITERLAAQQLTRDEVIGALLDAYEACTQRYDTLQLSHPMSLLGQVGIPEWRIPLVRLRRLAYLFARHGVIVEVSERWRCPSLHSVRVFRDAGVTVVASSDAQDARAVGRYRYVRLLGSRLR